MNPETDSKDKPPQPPNVEALADQILAKNLMNLATKLKNGGTLSAQELAIVQSAVNKSEAGTPKYARNIVELAEILMVDRRSIHRWMKKPGNPGRKQNGNYVVADWEKFKAEQGDTPDQDEGTTIAAARHRGVLIQNEREAFKLRTMMKEYVPKAGTKRVWTQLVNAAKARSLAGVGRLVTLVRMAGDSVEANQIARDEMIAIWREMERCEWYQPDNIQPTPKV